MTRDAAQWAAHEGPTPAANPEGGSNLPRTQAESPPGRRSRPAGNGAANEQEVGAPPQSTDLTARARRQNFGVRVVAERADGVVTSQVFADLAAAERKVARTRARGLHAQLHLVRVVPVGIEPLPLVTTAAALADLLDGGGDR